MYCNQSRGGSWRRRRRGGTAANSLRMYNRTYHLILPPLRTNLGYPRHLGLVTITYVLCSTLLGVELQEERIGEFFWFFGFFGNALHAVLIVCRCPKTKERNKKQKKGKEMGERDREKVKKGKGGQISGDEGRDGRTPLAVCHCRAS